ncbi:MAG: hypothetical protein K8U03_05790 [Planctomycetia bacterium]|nr:hypothetical protein [Planctomycetia bacterium]
MLASRVFLFAALATATLLGSFSDEARAAGPLAARRNYGQNFYESHGTIGSRMYPSPLPVPAWVGNTNYTYEPFYPHNHLWSHYDVYRRGATTTRALYW